MFRPACVRQPGVPLHLVQRSQGLERDDCLAALRDHAARFRCAVHAYALMGNHAHFLVTPADRTGAAALMDAMGGEFDATPVQARAYVLTCMRYIELNPVRAGFARAPEDYPWTSYHVNALGQADALVTPHAAYYALGRDAGVRRAAYRKLFRPAGLATSASRSRPSGDPRAR